MPYAYVKDFGSPAIWNQSGVHDTPTAGRTNQKLSCITSFGKSVPDEKMAANLKKEKEYSLDYILEAYVGGGGKWQWKQLSLLVIIISASQVPFYLHLYSTYTPSHRLGDSFHVQR